MIKIAFFDIDGTLSNMETRSVSDITIETLQRLQANNIKVCIATGRHPLSVPTFEGVTFDAILSFNGSYCFDKEGHVLYSHPIPHEDVLRIIENASSINRFVSLASKKDSKANGTDQDLDDYYAFSKQKVNVAEDFDSFVNEDIYQIMCGGYENEYDALMKNVEGAQITAWWNRAVDIIPAGGGKGNGIHKVLEYYHFTPEEAIAFGDGTNDIEMLETVGTGVAMGNATDNVKAIADDICLSVSKDGVYHYCLDHKLI